MQKKNKVSKNIKAKLVNKSANVKAKVDVEIKKEDKVKKVKKHFQLNAVKIIAILLVLVSASVPTYRYASKKIAEKYQTSEGFKKSFLGWALIVAQLEPNKKIKLEGPTLEIYNNMKNYIVKIAGIYPTLENLEIKANVLVPVDPEGAIKTYEKILDKAGSISIYTPKIDREAKKNYKYYFELAKLYMRVENKSKAVENIKEAVKLMPAGLDKNIVESIKKLGKDIEKMPEASDKKADKK